jgi:5-methylphenazine-1-carboxylate 1-monooxygenase
MTVLIAGGGIGGLTLALSLHQIGISAKVFENRRNGPEQVMRMVEERAPGGYTIVTDVLSQQELEDIAANYKRVAGFQVEGLNAKPPIVQIVR